MHNDDRLRIDLHKYHAALLHMESVGFPTEDALGDVTFNLGWASAFDTMDVKHMNSIRYERICVLFNSAAVESYQVSVLCFFPLLFALLCSLRCEGALSFRQFFFSRAKCDKQGAEEDRGTEMGVKKACQSFQSAAGMFSAILSILSPSSDDSSDPVGTGFGTQNPMLGCTKDLSSSCLKMLRDLMLAQGQLCVYEKAVASKNSTGASGAGGVKPSVLAKIAKSAEVFYKDVISLCRSPALSSCIESVWLDKLQYNMLNMSCASNYWESVHLSAVASSTGRGYGQEIARLTMADNYAEQAKVFAKKCNVDWGGLNTLKDTISRKKEDAVKVSASRFLFAVAGLICLVWFHLGWFSVTFLTICCFRWGCTQHTTS